MIELTVDSVRISVAGYQRVVVLKEREVDRYLLIWVGSSEAGSIAMSLQGVDPPRPLSHDLMQAILTKFGGRVTQVLINNLVDDTFYARITLDADGRQFSLDSRPSDAIALALRTKAPIYVEEIVMDKAGIIPETSPTGAKSQEGDLSIFRDFVNTLDQSDLSAPE